MRKQGIWVTRFVFLLLFVFVVAFMGYHIVEAVSDPASIVAAVLTDSDDFIRAQGFFVRDEQAIARPEGVVEVLAREGQRVSQDEPLALIYDDLDALSVSGQASELSERVRQLEAVRRLSADIADTAGLSQLIDRSLCDLMAHADGRNVTGVHDSGLMLKSLLYKWEATYNGGVDLDALIEAITLERDRTAARLQGRYTPVSGEVSGVFSPLTDGYEDLLTPERLFSFDLNDWDEFLRRDPPQTPENTLGRMARGFSFYYAAALPADQSAFLRPGRVLSVCLTGQDKRFEMQVVRVSEPEDGRSFVVLESRADMAQFISLRRESIDIRLASYSGIRVPREAIRLNDKGQTGVYCVVLTQAMFKPVDILLERDSYYLVTYKPEEIGALRPGDEIIIGGRDLYDGKNIR